MIILRINYDVVKHHISCVGAMKEIWICCSGCSAYRWGSFHNSLTILKYFPGFIETSVFCRRIIYFVAKSKMFPLN